MADDDQPPPASTASMTLDLIIRQRDDALVRLEELEPLASSFADTAAELERCHALLRRLSVILGVQEFESLEDVAMKKVTMLDAIMRKEILEGIRETARSAASTAAFDRIKELEDQIQRLQSRK